VTPSSADAPLEIDVRLVPRLAPLRDPAVRVVVDEIRASTTLTTLIELGCPIVHVGGSLAASRRLARATGSLLVGERRGRRPAGFDFSNSPVALRRAGVGGRSVVLSTTNGTAVLRRLADGGPILVGCLRNARACAAAAVGLATAAAAPVRIVCAGREGGFVLEDAIAAGLLVARAIEAAADAAVSTVLTDAAHAALDLLAAQPDLARALEDTDGGRTLRAIGEEEDVPYCAEVDRTTAVPLLVRDAGPRDGDPRDGDPRGAGLRVVRLAA